MVKAANMARPQSCEVSVAFHSQQPRSCVILENLIIADVAAQGIDRAMPAHVHHFEDANATGRRAPARGCSPSPARCRFGMDLPSTLSLMQSMSGHSTAYTVPRLPGRRARRCTRPDAVRCLQPSHDGHGCAAGSGQSKPAAAGPRSDAVPRARLFSQTRHVQ
jgi:hypothetical protein